MGIKNRIIIITGASRGIGEATAKYLSKLGAKVVLAARSTEIKKLASELPGSLAIITDIRKPNDIKNLTFQTLKKFGRIDVLINNAAQGMYGPMESIDIEEYKEIMELNVYGALRAMQAVIPQMKKQGGGQIINISSQVSKNYHPAISAYASTKYALNALSLTGRKELKKDNIIVSVFYPKMVNTDFDKRALGVEPYWEAEPGAKHPVINTPKEVAKKIVELIKSEAPEDEM